MSFVDAPNQVRGVSAVCREDTPPFQLVDLPSNEISTKPAVNGVVDRFQGGVITVGKRSV
jgi:hypothetical protein